MKSSVRILAIALALAFLLLARTAFQDSPTSAKEHIDLKDGEASFADPLNGLNEASFLGFGAAATKTVYFYVKSEDLGTKVTARTKYEGDTIQATDADATTADATLFGSALTYTLSGGSTAPSMVNQVTQTNAEDPAATAGNALVLPPATGADVSSVVTAFDTAYCAARSAVTAHYTDGGNLPNTASTTIAVPGAWGLLSITTGTIPGNCPAPGATGLPVADRMLVATTTADTLDADGNTVTDGATQMGAARTRLAAAAVKAANDAQIDPAIENNALQYMYKSGNTYVAATSTNPARRYTNGVGVGSGTPAATRDTVGGANKPLSGVVFKVVDMDKDDDDTAGNALADNYVLADDKTTKIPTFESDNAGGGFRLAYTIPDQAAPYLNTADTREYVVDATFDIVDVYEAKDTTAANAAYKAYTSGYARAYVSSGSDSGQWVTISEVAATVNNTDGTASPTSNLFQGSVIITNDTDHENDSTIYAQDGDSLTVQVFDENGNRSSTVLATATATIDDSPPTISDLNPADESIISDDTLRIAFNVNDDGAGSDFRNIEKVVTAVKVEKRAASGDEPRHTGDTCTLASGENDIDNAGGNASRVGVLVAPANAKFSGRCANIVDTGNGGKFNLTITARDLAGNVTFHTTQLTIDTAKPTVMGNPSVGQAWDDDKNKAKSSANSILIQFSESLDADTVAAADFTVKGYTVDAAAVVGTNEKDGAKNLNKYVVLTLTEDLANNARPSVTVEGVNDVAGNTIQKATRTSDNKIKAVITVVPFAALIAEDGEQAISFTSDEALRSKSGDNSTKGSANGSSLTVKVADDTMGGNATFKQSASAFEKSGAYGVMLQAVDIDGNVTRVGAVSVDDEDVKLALKNDVGATSTFDVKLANWPPADSDLDGSLKGEILAMVNDDKVASSTGEFDSKAGTVELMALGTAIDKDATLTLSYSYVTADQVIQVDVDKPTMVSIPADNKDTDYASGAIQFIWTEDKEYAGDTYKTVTLNEATHKGPSGTSTDITDMLTTNNNKRWVYRPDGDLALGAHEFTLKATDAAGNSATVSTTITVIERKPVEVSLSPGWNLISFRGAPASLDVNDVFSSDTVTVISQYDGRRVSPWTVWTRGSDGSLKSSPAGRMNIDPGLGFYVLSTDGSSLMVDIPGTSQDSPAEVPPYIDLIAGWNLIAVIIIDNKAKSVVVDDYLPAGTWTRAFKRDNATGVFSSISPLPEDSTDEGVSVNAGQALWVYATKAGTVVPK